MFVQRIGSLDKTRFGINFKAEDIKCNIKELDKKLKENTKYKNKENNK